MTLLNKILIFAILLMLYFAAAVSMQDSLNAIALYVVLPGAFVLAFLYSKQIAVNKYIGILMLLYLWIFFTALFSSDVAESGRHLKQIVGCVVLSYIFASLSKDEKTAPWLYLTYIISFSVMMYYVTNNLLNMIDVGEERADDEKLNANALAYYAFYVSFIVFIFGEVLRSGWLRAIFRVLFFGAIPLSFWIAYITASRQVLVIQIPLILILLYCRYWRFGGKRSKFFVVALCCSLIPIVHHYVLPMFEDSLLFERSQENLSEDGRALLIRETVEMGMNNPFVGVGPGCVRFYTTERTFAHNTFLELFAGTGIIGMVLFAVLLWKFLTAQFRRYRATRDRMYLYFLIFGLLFVMDQTFYVFYSSMYLISFFILVSSHSETYYRNRVLLAKNEMIE